jgi:rubrerythrin
MSENGSRRVVEFDIDRYVRNSKKVDLTQIDWEDIPNHPLSDGDVMCLHYMMDIETHTVIYLRDLLATRASHDPHVTAFLSCWVYEELWHGEAFSDFLRQYGLEVPAEPRLPDGSRPLPSRPARTAQVRERMGVGHQLFVLPSMLGSLLMRDFVALHMTWGAINELTTLTGYYQLIRRSHHPVLHQMLRKVIQDERRHFAFYRAQAKARLAVAPRRSRRLARWVFQSLWTPVGAGVKSEEEVDELALYLFGDGPEGREAIRELDDTIADIPGLEGLHLLEGVLDDALARTCDQSSSTTVIAPAGQASAAASSSSRVPSPV